MQLTLKLLLCGLENWMGVLLVEKIGQWHRHSHFDVITNSYVNNTSARQSNVGEKHTCYTPLTPIFGELSYLTRLIDAAVEIGQ